ncbi:PREDICTED: heat shock transcription factor, X-linked-like, partial [Propithecus coquereli]|uniref:heat shock transcription factor, X-linked-like n=1 Tax=Propithecus coquereli TaxID=379532 RepID=UPI00063F3979
TDHLEDRTSLNEDSQEIPKNQDPDGPTRQIRSESALQATPLRNDDLQVPLLPVPVMAAGPAASMAMFPHPPTLFHCCPNCCCVSEYVPGVERPQVYPDYADLHRYTKTSA